MCACMCAHVCGGNRWRCVMCGHVSVHIHLEHMYQYMRCRYMCVCICMWCVSLSTGSQLVCTHEHSIGVCAHVTQHSFNVSTSQVCGRWRRFTCARLSIAETHTSTSSVWCGRMCVYVDCLRRFTLSVDS